MARTSFQQKLGKKVRELRKSKEWSQIKLEELSSVDRTYISDIERGVRNPSIKTLEKLAKALKTSVSDLTNFDN